MEDVEPAEFKPNTAKAVQVQCVEGWSGRRDSNPRPSAPKADALPDCATPRLLLIVQDEIPHHGYPASTILCASHSIARISRNSGMRKIAATASPISSRKTQSFHVCRCGCSRCRDSRA